MTDAVARPAWTGRARNVWLLAATAGPGAILILLPTQEPPLAFRLVFGGLLIAIGIVFCSVRVDVSQTLVAVRLGLLGRPRKTFAIADITEVSSEDLRPRSYGGWGYRWCGKRCWAIVIRAGEALVIARADGRRLKITVDNAEEAADQVRSLCGL